MHLPPVTFDAHVERDSATCTEQEIYQHNDHASDQFLFHTRICIASALLASGVWCVIRPASFRAVVPVRGTRVLLPWAREMLAGAWGEDGGMSLSELQWWEGNPGGRVPALGSR